MALIRLLSHSQNTTPLKQDKRTLRDDQTPPTELPGVHPPARILADPEHFEPDPPRQDKGVQAARTVADKIQRVLRTMAGPQCPDKPFHLEAGSEQRSPVHQDPNLVPAQCKPRVVQFHAAEGRTT